MSEKYEYVQLSFDWGDLKELNELSSAGFKVRHIERIAYSADSRIKSSKLMALLERQIQVG